MNLSVFQSLSEENINRNMINNLYAPMIRALDDNLRRGFETSDVYMFTNINIKLFNKNRTEKLFYKMQTSLLK